MPSNSILLAAPRRVFDLVKEALRPISGEGLNTVTFARFDAEVSAVAFLMQ